MDLQKLLVELISTYSLTENMFSYYSAIIRLGRLYTTGSAFIRALSVQ